MIRATALTIALLLAGCSEPRPHAEDAPNDSSSNTVVPDSTAAVGNVYAQPIVIYVLATAAALDSARANYSVDDFAVIADDMMYYRATAFELLEKQSPKPVTVNGRGPLQFMVAGRPRSYDFAELPTLDLIIAYKPGAEPRAFAPVDVGSVLEYFAQQ